MTTTVKAYALIGFGVVPELPRAAVFLVRWNLLPDHVATDRRTVPNGRSNHERDS